MKTRKSMLAALALSSTIGLGCSPDTLLTPEGEAPSAKEVTYAAKGTSATQGIYLFTKIDGSSVFASAHGIN